MALNTHHNEAFIMYNKLETIDESLHPVAIDSQIILIVDPENREIINTAAKKGFRHPVITSKFLNQTLKKPHLFLYHKYNHHYDKEIDQKEYHQVLRLIDYSLRSFSETQQNICHLFILLDKSTIDYLHNYAKRYKFNVSGKTEQREVSGKFLLTMYELTENTFLVKVDESISNLGEKEETAAIDTVASFHTHPLEAYQKYNVCMAWPSIDDYIAFLSIYANGHGMFHIVGTVEGIYVITISSKLLKEGREKIRKNFEYYKKQIDEKYHANYPLCSRKRDNNDNNNDNNEDDEDELWDKNREQWEAKWKTRHNRWDKKVRDYLKKINSLKYFSVEFIYWRDATKPISINYQNIEGNCTYSDEQNRFIDFLNNDKNKMIEIPPKRVNHIQPVNL